MMGVVEENKMGSGKKTDDPIAHYAGLGVALGVAFGAAFGAAFDDVGTGVALGVAIGVAIGAALGSSAKKKQNDGGAGR